MNKNKLKKLRKQLEICQQSPQGRRVLVSIAKQLGREKVNHGKEPTYVNKEHPEWGPLTIPGHRGDLKPGTSRSIINALLSDVDEWEMVLDQSVKQGEEAGND